MPCGGSTQVCCVSDDRDLLFSCDDGLECTALPNPFDSLDGEPYGTVRMCLSQADLTGAPEELDIGALLALRLWRPCTRVDARLWSIGNSFA